MVALKNYFSCIERATRVLYTPTVRDYNLLEIFAMRVTVTKSNIFSENFKRHFSRAKNKKQHFDPELSVLEGWVVI